MKRWRRWVAIGFGAVVFVLATAPLISGEVRFLYRAAFEEARILWRRQALTDAIADSTVPAGLRDRLALVREARAFAVDVLGLDVGGSYTHFTDVGRDTLVLVLSASPPDRLQAHTWWFPIVGRVPYHGYFSLGAAERAARSLTERGLETYLRPAPAFSTLGWFPDPLLSTAVSRDSVVLAGTVFHELLHNTVWVPGSVAFNESLAQLVGRRSAQAFYAARGDTALAARAAHLWSDERILSHIQATLVADLHDAYRPGRAGPARDSLREAAFAHARAAWRAASLVVYDGERLAGRQLNNAMVIAAGLYQRDLDALDGMFDACGREVRQVIEAVRQVVDGEAGAALPCRQAVEGIMPDS